MFLFPLALSRVTYFKWVSISHFPILCNPYSLELQNIRCYVVLSAESPHNRRFNVEYWSSSNIIRTLHKWLFHCFPHNMRFCREVSFIIYWSLSQPVMENMLLKFYILLTKERGRMHIVLRLKQRSYLCVLQSRRTTGSLRRVHRLLVTANVVPSSPILSPWWWRRYVPLKRQFLQEQHSLSSQKMEFFIVTAVKTTNLT
jgi:hypothetical protein